MVYVQSFHPSQKGEVLELQRRFRATPMLGGVEHAVVTFKSLPEHVDRDVINRCHAFLVGDSESNCKTDRVRSQFKTCAGGLERLQRVRESGRSKTSWKTFQTYYGVKCEQSPRCQGSCRFEVTYSLECNGEPENEFEFAPLNTPQCSIV